MDNSDWVVLMVCFVIVGLLTIGLYTQNKERPAKIAAAEVLLDETPYPVHKLIDKASGKTMRCIMYNRSLIILPDALPEKAK